MPMHLIHLGWSNTWFAVPYDRFIQLDPLCCVSSSSAARWREKRQVSIWNWPSAPWLSTHDGSRCLGWWIRNLAHKWSFQFYGLRVFVGFCWLHFIPGYLSSAVPIFLPSQGKKDQEIQKLFLGPRDTGTLPPTICGVSKCTYKFLLAEHDFRVGVSRWDSRSFTLEKAKLAMETCHSKEEHNYTVIEH